MGRLALLGLLLLGLCITQMWLQVGLTKYGCRDVGCSEMTHQAPPDPGRPTSEGQHIPPRPDAPPGHHVQHTRHHDNASLQNVTHPACFDRQHTPPLVSTDPRYLVLPADRSAPLLFYVISASDNVAARQRVRRTWADACVHVRSGLVAEVVFAVGLPPEEGPTTLPAALQEESRLHGDLLVVHMVDTYLNLTLKSVRCLQWVATYRPAAQYITKVDDDVFLDVFAWQAEVTRWGRSARCNHGRACIGGHRWARSAVRRSGKWAMSRASWPAARYPPYVGGPAYLMTARAVRRLLAALSPPALWMPWEDLYLTGVTARRAHIKLVPFNGRVHILKELQRVGDADQLYVHGLGAQAWETAWAALLHQHLPLTTHRLDGS